jgi:hypothetical protein
MGHNHRHCHLRHGLDRHGGLEMIHTLGPRSMFYSAGWLRCPESNRDYRRLAVKTRRLVIHTRTRLNTREQGKEVLPVVVHIAPNVSRVFRMPAQPTLGPNYLSLPTDCACGVGSRACASRVNITLACHEQVVFCDLAHKVSRHSVARSTNPSVSPIGKDVNAPRIWIVGADDSIASYDGAMRLSGETQHPKPGATITPTYRRFLPPL